MAKDKNSNFNITDGIAFDNTEEIETTRTTVPKGKMQILEKQSKSISTTLYISKEAKKNINKYAKMYNYRSVSAFCNDLFERLDVYLGNEEN